MNNVTTLRMMLLLCCHGMVLGMNKVEEDYSSWSFEESSESYNELPLETKRNFIKQLLQEKDQHKEEKSIDNVLRYNIFHDTEEITFYRTLMEKGEAFYSNLPEICYFRGWRRNDWMQENDNPEGVLSLFKKYDNNVLREMIRHNTVPILHILVAFRDSYSLSYFFSRNSKNISDEDKKQLLDMTDFDGDSLRVRIKEHKKESEARTA